jgi:hypothetical protein
MTAVPRLCWLLSLSAHLGFHRLWYAQPGPEIFFGPGYIPPADSTPVAPVPSNSAQQRASYSSCVETW